MHRQWHTYLDMHTNTHRYIYIYMYAQRAMETQTEWRERQRRPGTSSAASPDVDKKQSFLHRYTSTDSLSSQASSSLATNHRTSSAASAKTSLSSLLPLLLHRCCCCSSTHTAPGLQTILIPEKTTRMRGKGDAEKTRRDGERERERRRPSGEKRGEGDVPVGSRAPNKPASGLARELPQSCSSPYLLPLLLHWSVCAFVRRVFVCVQETERGWERETVSKSRK